MRRKYLALIIVSLFIVTVFNSSIVAERDISRPPSRINDIITMKRELADFKEDYDNAKEEFEGLDDDVIQDCLDSGDYNELLKFMGNENNDENTSGRELNVHVAAKGSGLWLVKRMKIVKIVHPYPRLSQLGLLPPGVFNLWLFYMKFNETYPEIGYNKTEGYFETGNQTNASTIIRDQNTGEIIKYINGSHSILALVIQIMPINKIIQTCRTINNFLKKWRGDKDNDTIFAIDWPWSFQRWKFKHFWNFENPYSLLSTAEILFILMAWPFNIWTSFLAHIYASNIFGMAPFVIWSNSTATS